MRRPLLGAVVLLLVAGCGVSTDGSPRTLGAGEAPFSVPTAQPPATPVVNGVRTTIYLVRAEDRALVRRERSLPQDPTPQVLLQALQQGPDENERSSGLTTVVSDDAVIVPNAGLPPSVVTVQLPESSATNENLGLGQVVLTLTRLSSVSAVQFTRDGEPIQVPGPAGSLISGPLTSSAYTGLLVPDE